MIVPPHKIGNWTLEVGDWVLAIGDWRLGMYWVFGYDIRNFDNNVLAS